MTDQAPPPPHDQEENEVLRAARELQAQKEAAEATEGARGEAGGKGRKKAGWEAVGATGVGSAAGTAALLHATRDKLR
ncbi:MAG: hypothetical protein IBJ13_07450 [Sphingopyxis sp.]|nr:hypothetical protein [Sphingopyxis sp.]